jgi:amidase
VTDLGNLIWQPAREIARLIRSGDVSAEEVMGAFYDQIEQHNPTLNAIVNLIPRHAALTLARGADDKQRRGEPNGPLHGLPMAPKDTVDVEGFPTTWGFVPWADRVAKADGELAARQRQAGALFIGKTNMPEFALGSHTFNNLFGTTLNPYHLGKTAGGSSGGAAASLASAMLPLADGSDMGGSLRNPASFCNVVGLRPSLGRVPDSRGLGWIGRLGTSGPMARTVSDAALLLSVQAGPLSHDPLSLPAAGHELQSPPDVDPASLRLAWSTDLGLTPVDSQVSAVIEQAAEVFQGLGSRLDNDCPDLSGAMEVFQTQRAAYMAFLGRGLNQSLPNWRDFAKDTAIWNIEQGLALSAEQVLQSELERAAIYRRVVAFFEKYDALLLPAAQVPPFDIDTDWVREINGQAMATYIDWMTICCAISITGLPAISVPCGFTSDGLPIGLQIVGRPRGDVALLGIAHAFEQATLYHTRRPLIHEPG